MRHYTARGGAYGGAHQPEIVSGYVGTCDLCDRAFGDTLQKDHLPISDKIDSLLRQRYGMPMPQ
jgi:hypothetical protein